MFTLQASAAEEAALWKLTGEVMEVEQEVSAALATVCWLDAITAKARFGNWMGGTLATLVPFPKTGRDRRANKRSQVKLPNPTQSPTAASLHDKPCSRLAPQTPAHRWCIVVIGMDICSQPFAYWRL